MDMNNLVIKDFLDCNPRATVDSVLVNKNQEPVGAVISYPVRRYITTGDLRFKPCYRDKRGNPITPDLPKGWTHAELEKRGFQQTTIRFS